MGSKTRSALRVTSAPTPIHGSRSGNRDSLPTGRIAKAPMAAGKSATGEELRPTLMGALSTKITTKRSTRLGEPRLTYAHTLECAPRLQLHPSSEAKQDKLGGLRYFERQYVIYTLTVDVLSIPKRHIDYRTSSEWSRTDDCRRNYDETER